jgi:hypothetical protein
LFPSSTINPNPLDSLKNFTVPLLIILIYCVAHLIIDNVVYKAANLH